MKTLKLIFLLIILFNCLFGHVNLTKEEKEWIKNNPVVNLGVDSNWPPFDYVNVSGKHEGVSSEYIKLITEKTGLKFNVYSNSWPILISKIKNNELDVLACAVNTIDRQSYLNFTKPYLDIDLVVVGKKSNKIKNFNEIKNYKVAVQKDNFINERLKRKFPEIEFVFVNSNEEAFKSISYGKADFYIGNLAVITYFIEKDLLTNLEVKFKADFKKAKLSIAIYKEKELLYQILDKVINSISKDKRREINKKWIFDKSISSLSDRLIFDEDEMRWLQNNPVIKIVGDPRWPPFSFYEGGIHKGLIPDILKEIKKVSGLNFKHIDTTTWKESLELIKTDRVHMVNGVSLEVKRDYLKTTKKFLSSHVVIIGRKNNKNYFNSLVDLDEKLEDKKIGLIKRQSTSIKVANSISNHSGLVYFSSKEKTLKALSNGLVDYVVMNLPNFDFYTKKYSLSNLKILGSTGFINEYGFGVNNNEKELVSILNKILKYIPKNKIDEIYRQWIKIEYGEKINYSLIWKIVLIALAILLGTLYWNRKLKQEIKARELIQKDLEESKDFINAIMNSQKDIVIVKKGMELTQVNKSFFEFFDCENLESFKNTNACVSNLFDKNEPDKYIQQFEQGKLWIDYILDNPEKISKIKIYKNNKPYVFKITASYISKELSLKTAVLSDITKIEQLNKILVNAKNDALNIAKQRSEFLANMSHEIRTPMNSVIGFTELLDKEITNPIQKDYLNSIKKGGNSLLRIINDILDLSKIEAGKLEIKNEVVNPNDLFLEIESIFHSKIISKNINFIVEIDKNIPKFVILDGVRLRQILFNLIGNAIKFTEKGYIKLKVENLFKDEIRSKIDLIFSIEDTGIGIEDDQLEKIFNSFEQQTNQNVEKYGGTGLGLAICKKLIEMMNGEIKVVSTRGKGSLFKVIIHDVAISSMKKEENLNKRDLSNIIFENATILVVDDIEENRKLVQAALKPFNLSLIMAENGEDAITKLETINVDLILMDLRMPVMNGYEATLYIKKQEKYKDIPIIALTASVMGKDLKKVVEYGFNGYLRKPVLLNDLILKLSTFLEHSFSIVDEVNIEVEDEIVNFEELNILLSLLETKYKEEWLEIKDKGDFSLIEDFSQKLILLSEDNKSNLLKNYGNDLLSHVDSFDIEKVDYLMNTYLELIEKIKKQKENFERE